MYGHAMKTSCSTLILLIVLGACSRESTEPAPSAPTETAPSASAAPPPAATSSETSAPSESVAEAETGVWAGQIRIDAHAGVAWLHYVGKESGDFVPMRFRPDSAAGAKILAQCGDEDLCEVEGSVRFLDEPPPENASAIGEIVAVTRVRKLPPDTQ